MMIPWTLRGSRERRGERERKKKTVPIESRCQKEGGSQSIIADHCFEQRTKSNLFIRQQRLLLEQEKTQETSLSLCQSSWFAIDLELVSYLHCHRNSSQSPRNPNAAFFLRMEQLGEEEVSVDSEHGSRVTGWDTRGRFCGLILASRIAKRPPRPTVVGCSLKVATRHPAITT